MKKFRKYRRIQPRYNRYSFQTWIDDNMEMLREIRPSFNFETASLNDYYNAFEELYIEHTSDCFCQMYSGQLDRFFYNLLFVNYITNKNIVFPRSHSGLPYYYIINTVYVNTIYLSAHIRKISGIVVITAIRIPIL